MSLFKKFMTVRIPIVVITIWILLFGFFCVGIFEISANTHYADIPVISGQIENSCCEESLTGHFEVWKNIVLSTTKELDGALLALVVVVVAIQVLWPTTYQVTFNSLFLRYKTYTRDNLEIKTLDPLRCAFSRGILHPKTF